MQKFPFPEETLLFVYGTLRTEFSGNSYQHFLNMHAQILGRGFLCGKLYDLGNYPAAIAATDPENRIVGEIYALNPATHLELLRILDEYESCNGPAPEYVRRQCTVKLGNYIVRAWVYLYHREIENMIPIPDGDYVNHCMRKAR